ncbi:hypothetical protein ACFQI9_34535 [Paraburkholderia dipogonis]|uniref:hypothetical protein n=1 Tax=Paraburkholderia dipogonis TaxID=1211383 RepID=UPI0036098711
MSLDDGQDILILAPLIESARVAAEKFSAAFARDSASLMTLTKARSDLAKAESSLKEHVAIYERLKNANEEIRQLLKTDSLADATNVELTQVQSTADTIFRKIHSPNEYGVRRHASAPLFRLDNPKADVTLRDISTGQRAAFALSIFLAMNGKLQTAPPVLLFDDPVAHIDDFNSLSFLDHLRDLSLTESRQIFYATADARLAGLFEHKFAFLGDSFRRFDLSR